MTAADVAAAAPPAALREHVPPDFVEEFDGAMKRRQFRIAHLLRTDPGGAWVAEQDGEIVGCALALVREGVWGLSLLGVRPEHQAKGIGRELLARTLEYAEGRRGAIILSSEDPKAMRRYARAGFALRPCVTCAGIVDRSVLPSGLRSRPGSAADDQDLCDAASRAVRGAAHGPDVGAMEQAGCQLLVHDAGGWAAVRDGSPVLVAAANEAIARDLLWSALAASEPGSSVHVDFLTAGQDWAIEVCLEARLALSPEGPVFVRGEVGPMTPYVPSGAYL
jgi:GNAT superfamily N-acetyltransferase